MPPVFYTRQKKVIKNIRQYLELNGYGPTLREIAESMGLSSLATVHEHLSVLEEKNLIKRTGGRRRAIEIVNHNINFDGNNAVNVPVLGYIAAGAPLEPLNDPNATIQVPPTFVSGEKGVYVLQVRGESMIEEQIRDGDYVIVEHAENAKNGEIVVALLDNGMATLKRFFKEATRIRLEPANAKMTPIFVKNVSIQGKVVGLIRRYVN